MADSDEGIVADWIEEIPNQGRLFLRVHINSVPNRKLHPGIFREQGDAISVDWEKYSTAEETRRRARVPDQNGIVALMAGDVRSIEPLEVKHEPIRINRAHSGIHGLTLPGQLPAPESKTLRRSKLFQLVRDWEITPIWSK